VRDLNQSDKALRELLAERILVLDGAMGTMLQQRDLSAADFGGPALEGCNENLVANSAGRGAGPSTGSTLRPGRTLLKRTALVARRWCWRNMGSWRMRWN